MDKSKKKNDINVIGGEVVHDDGVEDCTVLVTDKIR